MPVIRVSEQTIQRLKTWAEPLQDTVDSALSKALDAAEAKREADRSRLSADGHETYDAFVEHLLAMPDVGDDADFERDPSPPRDVDL
ncbi:MAG: hypothetical protein F4029_16565 [Gammaproteobacteria bacterium]|nr:hypothetical protein [Gammaproteobacteria bacterium]MXY58008.1 hypothetical protein [Gammaproteobacteria bacterium]MYF31657.1 hypothetical protein [Gammaproteobacteria bacterium]MYK47830.1 hypothetical protein [Gammaproteobacteria bacterium]